MTLITNEIHIIDGIYNTIMVAAADRRITNRDGSYNSNRKKLFDIPYLSGAISYFGLASFQKNGRTQYLSSWIPNFINNQAGTPNLESFSKELRAGLNSDISKNILKKYPSGFHICGYNNNRLPEFWYLTNVGSMDGFNYKSLKPRYDRPSPDFLGRDALKLGWDGKNPFSIPNTSQVYRNGDYRSHSIVWEKVDAVFRELWRFNEFKKPDNPDDYGEYVKFKFEFIAYIYKQWAKCPIIGRPIDVWVKTSIDKDV